MNWTETGRFLILAGVIAIVIGVAFIFADKIQLFRLPGDLQFGSGRFRVYFPIATSILLSVLLTIILNFFSRR
ncbi:MAG: DUF2905 domain-containing protein [Chitinispirillaceae bacterium]|jgi:hypothetical protein